MASVPPYRIPTFYLPVADLKAWLASARPGDTFDYARGPGVNPNEPTVRLVAENVRAGLLNAFQRREAGSLVYLVQRKELAVRGAVVKRIRRDEAWEATDEGKLYLALVRVANMGLPCPTYQEMAEMCGFRDLQAARYQLNKLTKAGRVQVKADSSGRRVIKILETGRQTAGTV